MNQKPSKTEQHNAIQREYYETRSDQQNWRMLPDTSPYIANHVERFVDFAELNDTDDILDIGCGMGKFTLPLAAQGFKMEGLDLSPVLLRELKSRTPQGVSIPTHQADILAPPDELKKRFDQVTGFFMLHHLIDVEASFKQMRSLLKDSGKLAFLDVNPFCPLYYLQITLAPSMSWSAEKGLVNLTPKKVKKGLQEAGFANIKIKRYGILPPPLRNRFFGPAVDNLFDKARIFSPVAAFQLISATRSD
jgi:2-polyprenyl-3-methyl-5-hydroxy-6-metoxy-1,4-benzoquinol methylase